MKSIKVRHKRISKHLHLKLQTPLSVITLSKNKVMAKLTSMNKLLNKTLLLNKTKMMFMKMSSKQRVKNKIVLNRMYKYSKITRKFMHQRRMMTIMRTTNSFMKTQPRNLVATIQSKSSSRSTHNVQCARVTP